MIMTQNLLTSLFGVDEEETTKQQYNIDIIGQDIHRKRQNDIVYLHEQNWILLLLVFRLQYFAVVVDYWKDEFHSMQLINSLL